MPAPQNIGDAFNRFGTWLGDVTGLGGAHQVAPYQQNYAQSDQSRAQQMAMLGQLQGMYGGMAAGTGPSLAQGQLQQATDQNIRQAMALGAAQQGQGLGYASALRNIADQSAQARQQAAAQSAMMRNYEQMQGMQGLGNIAGMYGGVRGQDLGQTGMETQNAQYYGGLNANIDAQNAAGRRQFFGGILNAAGGLLGGGMGGGGGGGGMGQVSPGLMAAGSGPVLNGGLRMGGGGGSGGGMGDYGGGTQPGLYAYKGGMIPGYAYGGAIESYARGGMPSEPYEMDKGETPDQEAQESFLHQSMEQSGGRVPGFATGGDSKRNDTVPAMLSPGEIVLPRSITMAPNAGELSKQFVEMVKQHRAKLPEPDSHPMVRDAMRRKAA